MIKETDTAENIIATLVVILTIGTMAGVFSAGYNIVVVLLSTVIIATVATISGGFIHKWIK